jgi:hypothetical protein
MATLRTGDRFPALTVDTVDGPVELPRHYGGRALVVAFMRHFG